MGFVRDLASGKAYEEKVIGWVNKVFRLDAEQNSEKKGIDIISTNVNIEVKHDGTNKKTGNFFIEYQCNGKPSGAFAYDDGLFIIGDDDDAYIFRITFLQQLILDWIDNKTYRDVKGGDGWRVNGILLPITEAAKYSEGRIYFN